MINIAKDKCFSQKDTLIKQQRKGELRIMYTLEDIQAVDMEVANAITDEFERPKTG